MANIAIMDTGYLVTDSTSGTQATMANLGSAINLYSVEISFQAGGNIDTSPVINAASTGASNAKLNFGSINPSKLTISGVSNRKVTADMDLLDSLRDLTKTIGIKLLYYTSSTDGYRDITDSLGASDAVHNGSGKLLAASIPHIHVLFSNFTIKQTANSTMLEWSLECVETA